MNRSAKKRLAAAKTTCPIHDVVEDDVYPYRCSGCGFCFICQHTLVGYHSWVCPHGVRKATTMDPGVLVT